MCVTDIVSWRSTNPLAWLSFCFCFFFLQRPASGINGPFTAYRILYKSDGESEQTKDVQGFSNTTTTLGSLKIWTEYTIKIRVQNDKGLGPASAEKVQRTEEAGMQLFQSRRLFGLTASNGYHLLS